ncbi:MAG: hypothetical protein ACYTFK_04985 [Planctomycetota bacterium]
MGRKAVVFTFVIMVLALSVSGASANVIYVDASSPLGGDGQTWSTAYKYLQDGLSGASDSDQIWVAQGTYNPDQDESGFVIPGDRLATFHLVNGVAIFGGFPSGGGSWQSRDVDLYPTILSGDLLGNDVEVSVGVSLGNEPTRAENSYRIVTAVGCNSSTILDGVTITKGQASNCSSDSCRAAGMFFSNCYATLENCTFTKNYAFNRGGALGDFYNSRPTFNNCTFTENAAGDYGGAVYCREGTATMTNCTFSSNSSERSNGGAINLSYGTIIITKCTFTQNSSERYAGAIRGEYSDFMLTDCEFTQNSAKEGGAIYSTYGDASIVNCKFSENWTYLSGGNYDGIGGAIIAVHMYLVLNNSIFSGNRAARYAGGVHLSHSEAMLTNCTIVGNSADIPKYDRYGDGVYIIGGTSDVNITNCIFWGNKHEQVAKVSGALDMTYSCIEGGFSGVGNIDTNPFFVDAGLQLGGDYHLLPWSPCIDTADNSVVDSNYPDLDDNPRIADGDGDGVAVVDMGAYEFFNPNRPPIAEAGQNQTVYVCADGMARVGLDGSGSFDADGDELEYFWFESDEHIATGVDPNVQLSVGEHIIELVVDDGTVSSEPNTIIITVIGPVEADVHIVPKVINRNNRMKRVMAIIRLPEGIGRGDISDESFVLEPGGIEAIWQRVIGRDRVFAIFSKAELMDAVEGVGRVELTVIGKLESGRCIYGTDTVRIIQPRR